MTNTEQGTPIDPSDIRVGDKVQVRGRGSGRAVATVVRADGHEIRLSTSAWCPAKDAHNYAWSLLHRPEPEPSDHPSVAQ